MIVNRFVLCNMAARATRKLHNPHKIIRLEESLRAFTEQAKKYLSSGTDEEQRIKNLRGCNG